MTFVFVIIFVFVGVHIIVAPQLDLHQQAPHRSTGQLAKPSEGLLSHFQRSSLEFDQKKTSNQLKIAWLGESPTEKYQHYFLVWKVRTPARRGGRSPAGWDKILTFFLKHFGGKLPLLTQITLPIGRKLL